MILTKEDRERIEAQFAKRIFLIAQQPGPEQFTWQTLYKVLILDRIDQYIEHRIQADKVLEGILKDINGNLCQVADRFL